MKKKRSGKGAPGKLRKYSPFLVIALALSVAGGATLFYNLRTYTSITLTSTVEATFSIGPDNARGLEATFRVKKDSHTGSARSGGHVEGVATFDVSGGESPTYDFNLSPTPQPEFFHQATGSAWIGYSTDGRIIYLSDAGAFIEVSVEGSARELSGPGLAGIVDVTWSDDLDASLVTVEPPGSGPVACSERTTFLYQPYTGSFSSVRTGPYSCFLPGGAYIATTVIGPDGRTYLRTIDTTTGYTTGEYVLPEGLEAPRLAFSPAGHIIALSPAVLSADSNLWLLNTREGEVMQVTDTGYVGPFRWSPRGSYIIYDRLDPETNLSYLAAFSLYTQASTDLCLTTDLTKVDFYSDDVLLAGVPIRPHIFGSDDPASRDALVYASVITGRQGTVLAQDPDNPCYYSRVSIDGGNEYLTYVDGSGFHRVPVSGLLEQLVEFANNQRRGSADEEMMRRHSSNPPGELRLALARSETGLQGALRPCADAGGLVPPGAAPSPAAAPISPAAAPVVGVREGSARSGRRSLRGVGSGADEQENTG